MRQTIHIFLKDAHRSWTYIALLLAFTAMLTVLTPTGSPVYDASTGRINQLIETLHFLLAAGWWFTIAHVIQADALVGDRQFWVTRPYSWKSLLAAKLLFIAAFFTAPLLISDCIILSVDGFSPRHLIPSLLWRQCSLFGFPMLPAFILATVTRNMRQFTMACFLLVVAFVALIDLAQSTNPIADAVLYSSHPERGQWINEWHEVVLWPAGVAALLLWLYARRRTGVARAIAVAAFLWSTVDSAWPPKASARMPIQQAMPLEHPEITAAFAPDRTALEANGAAGYSDRIQIDIPITLGGRSRELLHPLLAMIRVEPEHGAPWSPQWTSINQITSRGGPDWIEFYLNHSEFQRLTAGPVRVRAFLAVIVSEAKTTVRIHAGDAWTEVPGFGRIRLPEHLAQPLLQWRVPVRLPDDGFLFSLRDPETGKVFHADLSEMYPPHPEPASISPVDDNVANVDWPGPPPWGHHPFPPPNSLCEFTVLHPVALIRRDLEIPAIGLADYAVGRP